MDRTRLLVIGIVALVLSAALSYVVYQRLQAKMAPQKVGVDVVVAANDIQIGAKIADRDLKVVKYPPEDLPPRVFHTKTSALGRGTVLPIGKGEFVVPDRLAADRRCSLMNRSWRATRQVHRRFTSVLDLPCQAFSFSISQRDDLCRRSSTEAEHRSATLL